jgi:acetoin utilization protein AcuC
VQHAVNFSGGLHHSMPDKASGFCVYSDIAAGITHLLDHGVQRIAYVDVDVHHGDGVERHFWDDPRVMTISIHQNGRTLFPGTGFPSDVGGPEARGTAVNVALPPGTGDDLWLRAFGGIVPELLEAFSPQVLFSQHGCDSHSLDPLAAFNLSVDGQRESYRQLHDLAHRLCDGLWVAVGGGGYEWIDVVPRAWTHLLAIAAGKPIPPSAETPSEYANYVANWLGRHPPSHMTDGRIPQAKPFDWNYNPDDPVDRAILATREAVFPYWGLFADPFGSL